MDRFYVLAGIALVSMGLITGCGSRDAEKSMAAARAHLAKGETAAGIIELKNALESRPDWGAARFLLGSSFFDSGDPVAAAIEFRRARDLQHPADEAVPMMARALLEAGEPRRVVELEASTRLSQPEAVASLKTTTALAHMALGKPQAARAAVSEALAAQSGFAPALLFLARETAANGDTNGALGAVKDLLKREPDNADALTLNGDLLQYAGNDPAAAAESYRKAIAANRNQVEAHAALIAQLIAAKDAEGVRRQLDALKSVRPRHPRTLYLEARWASAQGELARAHDLAQDLVRAIPDNAGIQQLFGVIALQRGDLPQAERAFARVMQLAPEDSASRILLGQTQLQAGDAAKALATLEPLLASTSPNAEALTVAGSAWLLAGDARRAETLLARATKLSPDDVAKRAALLRARLAQGDAQALRSLETLAGTDSGTTADMALISASIRQGKHDVALSAIDRLATKMSGSAQPPHLRGQVQVLKGDPAAARESFARALVINPKYLPSVEALAALDLKDGKPEQARQRYESLLKSDPENVAAIVSLARLGERSGRPSAEIAESLNRAILLRSADAALRRELVQFHLRRRDPRAALAVAQSAASALPDDPIVLQALASAQTAVGQKDQARATYGKLASMEPDSVRRQLDLARAHIAGADYERALAVVKKALASAPDDSAANELAVKLHLWAGRAEQAATLARDLQRRMPGAVLGHGLLGDVEMSRRRWDAAATAYGAALKIKPASLTAQRLHEALVAGGKAAAAQAWAASWRKAHPDDVEFVFHLGGMALHDGDHATAEARFLEVIRMRPDDALALNNLAWAQHALKKPGAIEHAERANQIKPHTPALMDTWAMLLADRNRLPQALELQTRAVEIAPDAAGLRLNLAKLLLRSGDKSAARPHLERLRQLGEAFASQQEVSDLLARL